MMESPDIPAWIILIAAIFCPAALAQYAWVEREPEGAVDQWWVSAGLSADGSTMIAGVYNGGLYTSADAGAHASPRAGG